MRDNSRVADELVAPIRVFMSYRRADDHHFIGRLHDQLCGAFGDDMVFRDIDSIPAGTNFRAVILRTLNEVDAVIAVIGPHWARHVDDTGSDYVYLELAEAITQNKQVIPVLMEQTSMPAPDTLPADLRALTEINAISVHGDPAFRRDSARLIEVIRNVVASDRARVAEERRAAEEAALRVEAERRERERLADELRAEERAARLRLAELEEAAARRQIELENARLAEIAERLRLTETVAATTPPDEADVVEPAVVEPAVVEPAVVEPAEVVEPARIVEPPTVTASAEPAAARTGGRSVPAQRLLQALIVAATVLGIVALSRNRSEDTPFNELSSGSQIDVAVWILTLAVAVPLFLGHRPIEQRFVLIGVAASAFFYHFLQAAVFVRYGTAGYDEGAWVVLKVLSAVCLIGAIWIVRHDAHPPPRTTPRINAVIVAMAIGCGVLVVAALKDQYDHAGALVENGIVPDRTPFAAWLVLLMLGPVGLIIGLALRPSYGARVVLATLATLGVVSYWAQARVVDEVFDVDGSPWMWTAVAHVPLAVVSWLTVAARLRQDDLAPSLDAA
jgi:hypothetical protein